MTVKSPWLAMTSDEWKQLRDLNGGLPIPDPETQSQLMNLRDDAFPALASTSTLDFNTPMNVGENSYLRRQSVPVVSNHGVQPSDLDLWKQRQKAIQNKSDFDAKLKALGLVNN